MFYLGARVAVLGKWDELYPIPTVDSKTHPGWPAGSIPKPAYQLLADESQIVDPFRFVYPPPSAIMLAPIGLLSVADALPLWWALSAVACWVSGLIAGELYFRLMARRDWLWAIVVVGIPACPLTWATVRLANTSAIVGLAIGWTLLGLATSRPILAGLGFYIGAAFKFATIPLLVIPLALGRVREVVTFFVISTLFLLLALAVTGVVPWYDFVYLTNRLAIPNGYPINVSLLAMIEDLIPLPGKKYAEILRLIAMVVSFGSIVMGLSLCRRQADANTVFAGALGLIGWFLVFAPTTQNHYLVYLYPLWGYLIAEAIGSRIGLVAAVAVIGFSFLPIGGSARLLPWPIHYHPLWAACTALSYGLLRLYFPRRVAGDS